MKPRLESVPTSLPEPPYPPETKAGSFPLDIEVDRMWSSDTWDLLSPELRPWWCMLFLLSWRQVPCGAFRNDTRIIAAKLGCSQKFVDLHREDLLRGWYLANDGRLYHPVITEKVLAILNRRSAWRSQKNQQRKSNVHQESQSVHHSSSPSSSSSSSSSSSNTPPGGGVGKTRAGATTPPPPPECPYGQIRNLWIETLPELPAPTPPDKWTDDRKRHIAARWQDELPDLDTWKLMMSEIRKSPFLMGRSHDDGKKPFRCNIWYITKPENLLRLQEGDFDG